MGEKRKREGTYKKKREKESGGEERKANQRQLIDGER